MLSTTTTLAIITGCNGTMPVIRGGSGSTVTGAAAGETAKGENQALV
jgi:hypothetical protein